MKAKHKSLRGRALSDEVCPGRTRRGRRGVLTLVYIQALSSLCWRFPPPLLPVTLTTLNPSGVDAVIVDLDGTMVDTMGDFSQALNRMLDDLACRPLPRS